MRYRQRIKNRIRSKRVSFAFQYDIKRAVKEGMLTLADVERLLKDWHNKRHVLKVTADIDNLPVVTFVHEGYTLQ